MPDAVMQLLIVDDDEAMARLLGSILDEAGWSSYRHVRTGREALELVAETDIVLLDHELPDASGVHLLPAIRARSARPAVIVVTAHGSESLAATALRHGADDYLIKDESLAELLPRVVERVRRNRALREALAAAERDLVHAERLAAIGQMNITLHHTINNPLMSAFTETAMLLRTEEHLSEAQRTSVEAIQAALQRILGIVQRASNLRHDATEEYTEGIRMIDLSRRTQAAPVFRGEALIHIPDEDSARVIALLLRHSGFTVARVENLAELREAMANPGLSLVVLMGSSGMNGEDPLGGLRPDPARRYTIAVLVAGDGTAARAAGADCVVALPFDPGTFTNDLLAAMRS
jgi:DNA-binding response OmpR family regulator